MTESNRVEYKRELTDSLEKEAVAFLNYQDGGVIYLGIDKNSSVYGIPKADSVQLAIKDRFKNNIQPSIMGLFDIALEKRTGKDILKITLASGLEKPYYLKKYGMTPKGCYIRVGSSAEPMPQNRIESLFSQRVRNTIGKMASTRLNLTFEQLHIYYNERGLKLNSSFMKNLEFLTPEGKANYAAYLLADENGISIQVAKYADTNRVNLIENRDFGRCSLIKALKAVLQRMEVENTIYTKIGYPLRQEREMINGNAMREAVVNAIVHNDYSNGSMPKFEFFSDRLEITSAGGLPFGVTVEDFFNGYSCPRNKEVMRVFRDLEIVEQLGSGVPRILEKYQRDVFEIRPNFIRVIFFYDKTVVETPALPTASGTREHKSGELVDGLVDRLGNGLVDKLVDELGNELPKNQRLIISFMAENSRISKQELARKIGISSVAIDKNISHMKKSGYLRREGSPKSGHWRILVEMANLGLVDRLGNGLVDRLVDGLVDNQSQIVSLLSKKPRTSKKEIAKNIGISTTTVDKILSQLKEKGVLQRVGNNKSGHWLIVEAKHEK